MTEFHAALHPAANAYEGLCSQTLGLGDDLDSPFPCRLDESPVVALGSKKSLPGAPLFSEVEDLPHDTLRAFYLDASCSPKGVIDEVEPGCLGAAAGPACSRLIHSTLVLWPAALGSHDLRGSVATPASGAANGASSRTTGDPVSRFLHYAVGRHNFRAGSRIVCGGKSLSARAESYC